MVRLPRTTVHLFWNVDVANLEIERDSDFILTRILERGRMVDVEWALDTYGLDRVRRFFRAAPRPELSRRTIQFWRVALDAKEERWPEAPPWRRNSSAPWID